MILTERNQKANLLRKEGKIKEALPIYRDLWNETGDKFDGAGLLHCLRKLELFEEANILADELTAKYLDFDWCRNEAIWTYIYGKLNKLESNVSLEDVLEVGNRIFELNPDGLAAKMVVFKVLKSAKSSNDWITINEWVVKLDPKSLSTKPMTDSSGREGWSDQSLWYNYRINGFIENESLNDAIDLVDEISENFPKQKKFFIRLKAKAQYKLGNLSESEKIYQSLCSSHKPDWWLVHEYAKVVRDAGRKDEALKLMYKAANSNPKLELMVSLFEDIGILCKNLKMNDEAIAHFILCKQIRIENEWSIPDAVLNNIIDLNDIIVNYTEPSSLSEALNICKNYWKNSLDEEVPLNNKQPDRRKTILNLMGNVNLGREEHPFCFIISKNGESFFCFKSDLPSNIKNNGAVTFDATPSFDKKKNKESWKASYIRLCD